MREKLFSLKAFIFFRKTQPDNSWNLYFPYSYKKAEVEK
ncbi:hypothetical protein CHCC20335_2592 [Bacillus paralicheniformis]|nr:hypothetical protein CHCC20335_2592 [Bacillus paralicheniformis]